MKRLKVFLTALLLPLFLFAQYTGGSGDGFAVWTSQEDISLPVELQSYHFSIAEKSILLSWQTASEVENLGFIVKRKKTTENSFRTLDSYRTNPELKGMGSSSIGRSYTFRDFAVIPNNGYVYQVLSVGYSGIAEPVFQTEAIEYTQQNASVPGDFSLGQNYPNPFNPSTTIAFSLAQKSRIKITVYAITGELVQILADGEYNRGKHTISFEPKGALSSNFYICRFQSGSFVKYLKMTYLK